MLFAAATLDVAGALSAVVVGYRRSGSVVFLNGVVAFLLLAVNRTGSRRGRGAERRGSSDSCGNATRRRSGGATRIAVGCCIVEASAWSVSGRRIGVVWCRPPARRLCDVETGPRVTVDASGRLPSGRLSVDVERHAP